MECRRPVAGLLLNGWPGIFLLSLHSQVIEPIKFLIKIRMSRIKQLNLLHVDSTNANMLHCLCVVRRGMAGRDWEQGQGMTDGVVRAYGQIDRL